MVESKSVTTGHISVSNVNIAFRRDGFLNDAAVATQVQQRGLARKSILGTDLWMMGTGELIVDEQFGISSSKDLSRATGLYNYAQAVTHRLMTSRGTHPEDPFFGVPWLSYLGRRYIDSNFVRSNLIQDITEELYKDPRTADVLSVKVEFENPTTVLVKCNVLPVGVDAEAVEIGLTIRNSANS